MLRWLLLLIIASPLQAAPNVLNGTSHAAGNIAPAVVAAVGSGVVDSSIFVDYDAGGTSVVNLIADSTNPGGSYTSVASGATVNHQPYAVMNYSRSGYNLMGDFFNYAALLADSAALTWPPAVLVNGAQPAHTPAPVIVFGATSRESTDGGTGDGVEFAIETTSCASACSFDIASDSSTSAALAGFVASLKYTHPTWNYFDIKGVLRQTAANWSTGYAPANYGYGTINYPSAAGVSSPSAIYLQPPNMQIQNYGYYARLTLYPFRSTRRSVEVVYSCTAGYSWPVLNEYTLATVTAGCGTLLYTSNGTDVMPVFTFAPAMTGSVTFVAFTTDGSGKYSRVEEFTPMSASFTVGAFCQH